VEFTYYCYPIVIKMIKVLWQQDRHLLFKHTLRQREIEKYKVDEGLRNNGNKKKL